MPDDPEPSFEADLADLDRTLKDLEDGTTTLDAALARYEQGVQLLRRCYARLRAAEQKIQQLTGLDESGRPILAPFAHASAVGSNETEPPRKRKTSS
ncbi:MAG TPA: exodeoxyribonuclease VII small subunit [Fimbriiglobus sp.]|jgi:exodeoxyribonuclease VII small subunit